MKRAQEVDRPRRGRELAAYYRGLLLEQSKSGRSVSEFAREVGVSAPTLYLWRRRLRREEGSGLAPKPNGGLVAVHVLPERGSDPSKRAGLALYLKGGHRIEVNQDFDASLLRRLLAVLERC